MKNNPLSELKDIHLPDPVSAWPPAYGWWLLAIVAVALLIGLILVYIRARHKRLAVRQALDELNRLDLSQADWPAGLNALLKRLTLSYLPRESSAALHQQQWLNLLTSLLPTKHRATFAKGYQPLLDGLYRPNPSLDDAESYRRLTRFWIKHALPPSKRRLKEASDV
ncbi:hypothetical protein GCM10009092_15550 [Bowmanella denitrificans]|uniref:DUF4381 domain-containing protein n=1 Tax=Bowmanella denitrificans TaxID=366582 RepID=A0ABN0X0I4_9ALTE